MTTHNGRKSLIPVQIKWDEVGTTVVGYLIDKTNTVYQGNTRGRYLMETHEGNRVFMGGFILDQALNPVALGTKIGIEYQGEEEKGRGGNKLKLFEVWEVIPEPLDSNSLSQEEQEKAVSTPKK